MMAMQKLTRQSKRLTIRPLELKDYKTWRHCHTTMLPKRNKRDRTNKTLQDVSLSKFKRILSSQKRLRAEDRFYDLGVFENSSGKLIGTVAIMDVLRGLGQSAYLGYFINNTHWGLGYGKEAARLAIDIAFWDVKLHRIEAGIEPTNRRSILLARSLGLRKEGLKKQAVFLRGRWNDLVMYSATCEEFGFKWKGIPQTRPR